MRDDLMDIYSTDDIREVWVLLLQLLYKTTENTRTPHAEHIIEMLWMFKGGTEQINVMFVTIIGVGHPKLLKGNII